MDLVTITDALADDIITGGSPAVQITGGAIKYHNDHDKPAVKDSVISRILPDEVPECIGAIARGHCISTETVEKINTALKDRVSNKDIAGARDTADAAGAKDIAGKLDPIAVIERAKAVTGCDTESCILKALEPDLGRAIVSGELTNNFTVKGPTDNKLLSNINIDTVMKQYADLFPGFYPYNFNMRNYASYRFRKGYVEASPDSLATVQFSDLYANGYNCCGCVINDDKYQGPGTHWMALFACTRGDEWKVEFFNSSGNGPAPEWVNWLVKTKSQMEDLSEKNKKSGRVRVEIKNCSVIRHQQSRTECGLYSLFYIFARLNGVPCDYFMQNPVPDQLMFEFRQILFGGEKGIVGGKFDWDKYRKQVSVAWE